MFRTRAAALSSFAAVGVLLLSACGGGDGDGDDKAAANASSAPPAASANLEFTPGTAQENKARPNTGDFAANAMPSVTESKPVVRKWIQLSADKAGELDPVVINGAGFTLYRFDKDTADPSKSNCVDDCATTWPPYLVANKGRVFLDGVDKSAIGFIPRDGGLQVTLGGWPVYLFSKDLKPGDTNGQGVGGTWFGVAPDGQKAGAGAAPEGDGDGGNGDGASADSATFFDGSRFAEPAEGITGPGCKPVRFTGSLKVTGAVKIWDGADCTGKSLVVDGDVNDLAKLGFPEVKSIRFSD
ncbi:hypothetical protein [Streptomyces aurantiacus]|uniref:hypothetical protein n=1 Tax=Streptomyces aurantiacus TaxID=47760 RepID=UPI0006E1F36B|nr:hypothetical protein [Streptomyces aurantiacus]